MRDNPPPRVTIVGIGGALGSGASTVARLLKAHVGPERCVVIDADDCLLGEDGDSLVLRLREIRSRRGSSASSSDTLVIFQGSVLLTTPLLQGLFDVTVFIDVPSAVLVARSGSRERGDHGESILRPIQSRDTGNEGESDMFARSADIIVDGVSLSALDSNVLWGAIRTASSRGKL